MAEEDMCKELRSKNIDDTGSYFVDEINRNELINKKHEKRLVRFQIIMNNYLLYFLWL